MDEFTKDEDILKIQQDKESAMVFRERKHDDWTDNNTLYRDRVITNRLTQRQTINIPLMRYGLQTIMKDIDDAPQLFFKNLDNNQQKEIFYNEYWNKTAEINRLPIKDRIDKKQALLFGRTFKKLNIRNGMFTFSVEDPQDMLVERHVDPSDLDSARFLCQTDIYRTLTSVIEDERYDKGARTALKQYFAKDSTSQEQESNMNSYQEKAERMSEMGLIDAFDPLVGETYIELNEVFRKEWNKDIEDEEIIMYTVASTDGGMFKLLKKPFNEVVGKTEDDFWQSHFPYTSWGTDLERGDFWSDCPGDTLRQPCKVLNSWASGLVENRTLKNLNMHYYDSSEPTFVPQTFQPVPWGWYPTPGDPNKIIKDVAVPDLSDSLDEIQFMISIAEKSVAASGTQTGQTEQRQITLGEVQLAVANAQERTKSSALFYIEDWKSFGLKYTKMLDAKMDELDILKIGKKGRNSSRIYVKEVSPKDWYSKGGYKVEVKIKEDKDMEDTNNINKLKAVQASMPMNVPLQNIIKRKLLDFANVSSDDQKEVMDFEEQNMTPPIDPATGLPMVQQMTSGAATMPQAQPMAQ
jgi:hypothetical protein